MTLGDRLGRRLSRKAVLAILVLCVFGIVAIAITPKSYDLQVGSVPEENITAPREVEDTAATDALKKRAREAVSPVYSKDGAETVTMQEKIQAYYEEIDQVRNHAFVQLDAVSSQWEAAGQIGPAPTLETVLTEAFYQELNQLMPEQVDNETLHQLLLATDAQWQAAKNQATESSNAAFENGVGEDAVVLTRDGVQKQLEALDVPDVCKPVSYTHLRHADRNLRRYGAGQKARLHGGCFPSFRRNRGQDVYKRQEQEVVLETQQKDGFLGHTRGYAPVLVRGEGLAMQQVRRVFIEKADKNLCKGLAK